MATNTTINSPLALPLTNQQVITHSKQQILIRAGQIVFLELRGRGQIQIIVLIYERNNLLIKTPPHNWLDEMFQQNFSKREC